MAYASTNPVVVADIEIPEGDAGIKITCDYIRQYIDDGARDPNIVALVDRVLAGCNRSQKKQVSILLTGWFSKRIQYKPDDSLTLTEAGLKWIDNKKCPTAYRSCEPVEMVHSASQILRQRSGDCDDFCVLLGAMHKAAGIVPKLCVIAADRESPTEFSHIYLLVEIDGSEIPIDPVNRRSPWGWEYPNPQRKEIL